MSRIGSLWYRKRRPVRGKHRGGKKHGARSGNFANPSFTKRVNKRKRRRKIANESRRRNR